MRKELIVKETSFLNNEIKKIQIIIINQNKEERYSRVSRLSDTRYSA